MSRKEDEVRIISQLSEVMQKKLSLPENREKKSWKHLTYTDLFSLTLQEIEEVSSEMRWYLAYHKPKDVANRVKSLKAAELEIADVANFLAMMLDNIKTEINQLEKGS